MGWFNHQLAYDHGDFNRFLRPPRRLETTCGDHVQVDEPIFPPPQSFTLDSVHGHITALVDKVVYNYMIYNNLSDIQMFIAYRCLFYISNSLYDQSYAARYLPFPNLLFRFFLQLQSSQLPGASYRAERLEGAFAKVAKHGCTGEEQEIFNRATWMT